MANQGELPNHPAMAQHIGHANMPAVHRDNLVDAARALMLLGAAAAVSTVCNPGADAAWAFLGFVTWVLGVCLLSLLPLAADRFPVADRVAGAAIANAGAVLRHLFTPWN